MKHTVTLGNIRNIIKEITKKHANEKDATKKHEIEKEIATIINCIKEELGEFSSVAHDNNILHSPKIKNAYKNIKKHLQE